MSYNYYNQPRHVTVGMEWYENGLVGRGLRFTSGIREKGLVDDRTGAMNFLFTVEINNSYMSNSHRKRPPLCPKMTYSDINETHFLCFQTKNKLIRVNQKIMTYVFLKILTFKWSHGRYHGHLTGVTQTFLEKSQKKRKLLLAFSCHCDFMIRAQEFLSLFDHNITAHSIVIPISLGNHFHGRYHGRVSEY